MGLGKGRNQEGKEWNRKWDREMVGKGGKRVGNGEGKEWEMEKK